MEKLKVIYGKNVDFQPSDLLIKKYVLPDTYGNLAAEELMARIIEFSIEENQWVAVSASDLAGSVWQTFQMQYIAREIHRRNTEKKQNYLDEIRRFRSRIYAIFGNSPTEPEYENEISVPSTVLNPDSVVDGYNFLFSNNLLDLLDLKEDSYLKPTEKAILALKKFVLKDD